MVVVVAEVVASGGVGVIQGGYGPVGAACRILASGKWAMGHGVGCVAQPRGWARSSEQRWLWGMYRRLLGDSNV